MIKYDLLCSDCETGFEAWFSSSDGYDEQAKKKQIACPSCSSVSIAKQIMAPAVRTSGQKSDMPDPKKFVEEIARKTRKHISENFDYVGENFADEARSIHSGASDDRPIWGKATEAESTALAEEGVASSPLPKPFAPEPPKSKDELN